MSVVLLLCLMLPLLPGVALADRTGWEVVENGWGGPTDSGWSGPEDLTYGLPFSVGSTRTWISTIRWLPDGTLDSIQVAAEITARASCTTAEGFSGYQDSWTSTWTPAEGQGSQWQRISHEVSPCTGYNKEPVIHSFTCSPENPLPGQAVTCSVQASDPDGHTLTYFISNGITDTTATTFVFTAGTYPTTYSVGVRVRDPYDGDVRAFATVTVAPPLVKAAASCTKTEVTANNSDTTLCTATASEGVGPYRFVWSDGTQGAFLTGGPYRPTEAPATISRTVTAYDDGTGKTATASVSWSVKAPGGGAAMSVALTCDKAQINTGETNGCQATASHVPAGQTPTWSWSPTPASSQGASATYGPYSTAQTVSVRVTATAGGTSASATFDFTVVSPQAPPPPPPADSGLTVTVTCSPSSIDTGSTTSCSASVTGAKGQVTYTWDNGKTGNPVTYGPYWSSGARTASVSVTTPTQTGQGSATFWVSVPCYPSADTRSLQSVLSVSTTPTGSPVRVTATLSGTLIGTPGVATSWGEVQSMVGGGSTWSATVIPPRGALGDQAVTVSATLSQGDGCGGTYGPSTYQDRDTVSVFTLQTSEPEDQVPEDEPMTSANLTLQEYLTICLGSPEPWYCGISLAQATTYVPQLQAAREAYYSQLGAERWAVLIRRIDKALTEGGNPPSGLAD